MAKKDKRGSRSAAIKRNASLAHMSVEQYKKWLDKERLHVWTKKRRQDPTYRKQCAERQKAKHDQLVADAELGRMARAFLANLGSLFEDLANLKQRATALGGAVGQDGEAGNE